MAHRCGVPGAGTELQMCEQRLPLAALRPCRGGAGAGQGEASPAVAPCLPAALPDY